MSQKLTLLHGFTVHQSVLEFYAEHPCLNAVPRNISVVLIVDDPLHDPFVLAGCSAVYGVAPDAPPPAPPQKHDDDNDNDDDEDTYDDEVVEPDSPKPTAYMVHPTAIEGHLRMAEGTFLGNIQLILEDVFLNAVVIEHGRDNRLLIRAPLHFDESYEILFESRVLMPHDTAHVGQTETIGKTIVVCARITGRRSAAFVTSILCQSISDAKHEIRIIVREWMDMLKQEEQSAPSVQEMLLIMGMGQLGDQYKPMMKLLAAALAKTNPNCGTQGVVTGILKRISKFDCFVAVDCFKLLLMLDKDKPPSTEDERPRSVNSVLDHVPCHTVCGKSTYDAIEWFVRRQAVETLMEYADPIDRPDMQQQQQAQ